MQCGFFNTILHYIFCFTFPVLPGDLPSVIKEIIYSIHYSPGYFLMFQIILINLFSKVMMYSFCPKVSIWSYLCCVYFSPIICRYLLKFATVNIMFRFLLQRMINPWAVLSFLLFSFLIHFKGSIFHENEVYWMLICPLFKKVVLLSVFYMLLFDFVHVRKWNFVISFFTLAWCSRNCVQLCVPDDNIIFSYFLNLIIN